MPTKPKKRGRPAGSKNKIYKPMLHRKEISLDEAMVKYSPAPVLTLCGQLEDSVILLENRISNVIAKINSLM